MNIALMHFRVGETDGVSLEMDKWKRVLEKSGHQVSYIAGTTGTCDGFVIPELNYRGDKDLLINDEAYVTLQSYSAEKLKEEILSVSKSIEEQLIEIIRKNDIHVLVPNNILSLGRSPQTALAVMNALKITGIKAVAHHHDFYWERDFFANPTTPFIMEMLDLCFPPKDLDQQLKHVVINTLAKTDLMEKKGLSSTVVPNVFDFKADAWVVDGYNQSFRNDIGVKDNEVLLLQATRVTDRKAIELAIDLVCELNKKANKEKMYGKSIYDGRVLKEDFEYVLALVGIHEGSPGYSEKLVKHAGDKGVKMIVNDTLVRHSRGISESGEKQYSLWDAYVDCDFITYPSIYEGWGNQFLEGIFAKKPQVVFEYSVYESDIKQMNFNIVTLGNRYTLRENGLAKVEKAILKEKAEEVMNILLEKTLYNKIVEENFAIAEEKLSLEALESMLNEIFSDLQ